MKPPRSATAAGPEASGGLRRVETLLEVVKRLGKLRGGETSQQKLMVAISHGKVRLVKHLAPGEAKHCCIWDHSCYSPLHTVVQRVCAGESAHPSIVVTSSPSSELRPPPEEVSG